MRTLVCLILGLVGVFSESVLAEEVLRAIYFSRGGSIYRAQPDGTNETLVLATGEAVVDLTVDSRTNSIYWSSLGIRRCTLAGGNPETLVNGSNGPFGLDRTNGDLYFMRPGTDLLSTNLVRRDGATGDEVVVIGAISIFQLMELGDIEIDHQRQYAYMLDAGGSLLSRARTDLVGQNPIGLESVMFGPIDSLAIDHQSDLLYTIRTVEPTPDDFPPPVLSRLSLETLEWETSSYSSDVMYDYPTNIAIIAGTEDVYFCLDHQRPCSIMTAAFSGETAEEIISNVGTFALDAIPAGASDTEPPQLTLFAPTSGSTNNRRISIVGMVTDNNLVANVSWKLNNVSQGSIAVFEGGTFGQSGVDLSPGENLIEVIAVDLDGNETTKTVDVTWRPDRTLSIGNPQNTIEGQPVTVPVSLLSSGDVSGVTMEINYEPRDLRSLLFEPAAALDGASVTSNLTSPGKVTVTFATPGTTILSGDQLLGNLTFRARSVASILTTALTVEILDVSDSTGTPILVGNIATGTDITIEQREFTADVNTNGRIDIGDAFLMQQLLAGLEEKRAWDDALNDINGSNALDSGDVVQVLRTVLGILPQPESSNQILALSSGVISEDYGPKTILVVDDILPSSGDTITVRVLMDDLEADIGGASFRVDYPVDALQLEDATSHMAGSIVPGGVLGLWNVAPSNDFDNQTGTVSFAASGSSVWPSSATGGELGVLKFKVTSNIANQSTWTISLSNVELTNAGYNVHTTSGDIIPIVGQSQTFQSWAATQFTVEQLADANISGWTADPDGDGESNGQEYFQGSSALNGNGQTLSGAVYLTSGGEEIPLIRLQHSISHQAIDYQLQQSTDLEQWNNVDSQVYQRTLTGNATQDLYIGPMATPAPSDRIFLRLLFSNTEGQL